MSKVWAWGLSGCFLVVGCLLLFPTSETKVQIGKRLYSYKLPLLVKAAAFREREYVYTFFVDDVIAPGVTDKEEKALKIFSWINEHVADPPRSIHETMERHELDFLMRKYGSFLERIRIFRNLLAFQNALRGR